MKAEINSKGKIAIVFEEDDYEIKNQYDLVKKMVSVLETLVIVKSLEN